MGGTRYFGRNLVFRLLEQGHDITILTTGKTKDPFGNHVERWRASRSNRSQMNSVVSNPIFDVVYDQISFSPVDAKIACEIFSGKVGKYIFTSSIYVYEKGLNHKESDFDPTHGKIRMETRNTLNYEEGKRFAEMVYMRYENMPVVCVRFPVVIGYKDYTNRFNSHINSIINNEPILIPLPSGQMNVISAENAGEFLEWIGTRNHIGPINVACPDIIRAEDLTKMIAESIGKREIILREDKTGHYPVSMYHQYTDLTVNISMSKNLGFSALSISTWLPLEVTKFLKPSVSI